MPTERRVRILVADDDAGVRDLLRAVLVEAGYEVETTPDGRLRGLDLPTFDLAFIDVYMPECDGLEVLTRLRREAPNMRLVSMSGRPDFYGMRTLEVAAQVGADATLVKPFLRAEVLRLCASLLGGAPGRSRGVEETGPR